MMNIVRFDVNVRILIILLGLIGALAFAWRLSARPPTTAAQPLPPLPTIDPRSIQTVVARDAIPAIDEPKFERGSNVGDEMKPEEKIIGVVINRDARAFPLTILSLHEIVNAEIGREPVAVTWCPLCYSALVFSRRIDNHPGPLTFGVSGKLLYNTLLMYDRETESLWSQLYGGAIEGPLAGTTLNVFASRLTTWEMWLGEYPDTLVLSKRLTRIQFNRPGYSLDPRGSYLVDPYAGYYKSADEGVVDAQIPRDDASLQPKRRVFGVRVADLTRAYPHSRLAAEGVLNDRLGETALVIWFDPESETAAAYDRRVDDHELTFAAVADARLYMLDLETGSIWSGLSGVALEGPMKGAQLTPLIGLSAFEFGWRDYFGD